MSATRDQLVRDAAARGKYAPLYRHLLSARPEPKWRTTFGELEGILGFRLPDSARLHRPWWSNSKKGSGHSHALAWQAAGWRTREVDIEAETLVFARSAGTSASGGPPGSAAEILHRGDPATTRSGPLAGGLHGEPRADL